MLRQASSLGDRGFRGTDCDSLYISTQRGENTPETDDPLCVLEAHSVSYILTGFREAWAVNVGHGFPS